MPAAPNHRTLNCPHCAAAMTPLELEGHYGQPVHTDLCSHCDLLWLDELEVVNLSGLGWVALLRRMQAAQAEPVGALRDASALDCPRCGKTLRRVFNQSRLGHFGQLECPGCRGTLASFGLLLAQRGLVRPLTRRDLGVLQAEGRSPCCLNCGAGLTREQCATPAEREARCSYCASPLLVIDMPRFLGALLRRHAETLAAPERIGWACRGCGVPLEPTHSAACESCGHLVVVPSLLELRPVLDAIEPPLRGVPARGPGRHGQKLRAMRGDATQTALHRYLLQIRSWISRGD